MKRTLAIIALIVPLAAAPLRAGTPSDDFRAKFKPYEQWMLDVVLSDPKQKAVFDVDAVADQKGGDDSTRVEMKWRKTLISFAQYYKNKLDSTDIIPDAPSVEKMVTPEEFNITQYYWLRKPEKERESFKSDIATGNNLLGYGGRKLVESKVRKGRQTFSADIGQYLDDPDSKKALAYVAPAPKPAPVVQQPVAQQPLPQPAPKPKPKPEPKDPPKEPTPQPTVKPDNPSGARDQLDNIARNTPGGGSAESGSERAGSGFTGGGTHQEAPPTPVDGQSGQPTPAPSLTGPSLAAPGAPQGGFVVAPPPAPVLDQNKTQKEGGSKVKLYLVKYGPPALGAIGLGCLFAALGALFLGPLGAIGGAVLGAAIGFKAGQWAGKKLIGA